MSELDLYLGRVCFFLPCVERRRRSTWNVGCTVSFQNLTLQIELVRWRTTLAGCAVIARQHLDGTLSLSYGPHSLGRYDERGGPILNSKPASGKAENPPHHFASEACSPMRAGATGTGGWLINSQYWPTFFTVSRNWPKSTGF
jgi:hypothetical protein